MPYNNILPSPSSSSISSTSIAQELEKTQGKLFSVLQTTFHARKDIEKDSKLAAEIGKSLSMNNNKLQTDHVLLINEIPYPTPSNSGSLLMQDSQLLCSDHCNFQDYTHKTQEYLEEEEMEKTLTKAGDHANLTTWNCRNCLKLNVEMERLQIEYEHVSKLKALKEKRLNETLNDMLTLQEQYDSSSQDHQILQTAYKIQSLQIEGLQANVESYQRRLHKLNYTSVSSSQCSEYCYSPYIGITNDDDSLVSENIDEFAGHCLYQTSLFYNNKNNDCSTMFQNPPKMVKYPSLEEFVHKQADEASKCSLNEKRGLWYHEKNYFKSTYLCKQPFSVPSILCLAWRWLRFSLVMTIAIFINLKEGPSTLEK